jgi:hypothetical protein
MRPEIWRSPTALILSSVSKENLSQVVNKATEQPNAELMGIPQGPAPDADFLGADLIRNLGCYHARDARTDSDHGSCYRLDLDSSWSCTIFPRASSSRLGYPSARVSYPILPKSM